MAGCAVRHAALLLLACVAACQSERPALGHVVVFLDTDAPLPRASAPPPPIDQPQPLFDRIGLEVFPPGASQPCTNCLQEFDLSEEQVRAGISFVVRVDSATSIARVRARMYRFLAGVDLPPAPEAIVEVVAELPTQPEEGATEV